MNKSTFPRLIVADNRPCSMSANHTVLELLPKAATEPNHPVLNEPAAEVWRHRPIC